MKIQKIRAPSFNGQHISDQNKVDSPKNNIKQLACCEPKQLYTFPQMPWSRAGCIFLTELRQQVIHLQKTRPRPVETKRNSRPHQDSVGWGPDLRTPGTHSLATSVSMFCFFIFSACDSLLIGGFKPVQTYKHIVIKCPHHRKLKIGN